MTTHQPNNMRLQSLIREISQLAGVEFALVTLTSSPMGAETCAATAVNHNIEPFDQRYYSVFASPEFKNHIVSVVEDTLAPSLAEQKQAQELPRTYIDLTNTETLVAYLAHCLYLLQQETCKNIARTWIKFIEPKKQSKYPYKRGFETAPPWWPRGVTHKEPDHLQKSERINLLSHLLLYSDFPLAALMEATNDNRDVVPSPKRVFVDQAFEIAQVYRLLHRTTHTTGLISLTTYSNYEVINVHLLTYGQNRYERKEDSRVNSRAVSYRGFGMLLPNEDNRALVVKRETNSSSPVMLSPGYPMHSSSSGNVTPRITMEPHLHRGEPPRGYFKPHFEPYRSVSTTNSQSSVQPTSKYLYTSNHYASAYSGYTPTLASQSPYLGGYYGQSLVDTHQMRSPPSSASSANTSVDSTEEYGLGSQKRSIAVDDVRPLKRSVSR